MPQSIKELTEARQKLFTDNKALLDKAEGENRNLTAEEQQEYDRRDQEIDQLTDKIQAQLDHDTRRQRLTALQADMNRPLPRQIIPSQPGVKPVGGDGAALAWEWGRHKLNLVVETQEWLRAQPVYRENFAAYLRGEDRVERLGLQVGKDTQGGYLAPMPLASAIIKFLDNNVFMRGLATVLPPLGSAVSLGVPTYDTDPGDATWTAEVPASDISEDTAATFGKRELTPHLLTKLIKLSNKILRSSTINIEDFMASRLGYKFGITEEQAFLTGTGAQQPLGVFTASNDGISTSRDTAASATTAFTYDDLINCFFALKEQYQTRSTWLVSREFVKRCRKLKSGDGLPVWGGGIVGGNAATIMERPYRMSEYVPSTYTTGLYVAIVGDFSFYYIADSLNLEIQRLGELFSLRNQVGLLARKETDGMPVLEEAFSRLKLA